MTPGLGNVGSGLVPSSQPPTMTLVSMFPKEVGDLLGGLRPKRLLA